MKKKLFLLFAFITLGSGYMMNARTVCWTSPCGTLECTCSGCYETLEEMEAAMDDVDEYVCGNNEQGEQGE